MLGVGRDESHLEKILCVGRDERHQMKLSDKQIQDE